MDLFHFLISTQTLEEKTRLARLTTLFQEEPSIVDPDTESPLAIAVECRCTEEIARFLLKRGCPVDKSSETYTPLCLAVRLGRVDLVDIFLAHGANHAKKSGNFRTPPIVFAAQQPHNKTSLLESLLRHDPHHQIDWTDRNGVTALRSAAKYGNLEAARLLLSRGADPSMADIKGYTALDMCRSNDFFPKLYFSDQVITIIKNRTLIAKLLEEEERAYIVYKGKALSNARFVATHYYPRDCWSLNHLPEVLKKRMVNKKQLPSLFYTTTGLRSCPGGEVMEFETPSLVQEVLHEVWSRSNSDVFQELMSFLVL
ncbi:MAG: ankyrin repeat domain-containing protein [Terrimicrobiaceae bacterium]